MPHVNGRALLKSLIPITCLGPVLGLIYLLYSSADEPHLRYSAVNLAMISAIVFSCLASMCLLRFTTMDSRLDNLIKNDVRLCGWVGSLSIVESKVDTNYKFRCFNKRYRETLMKNISEQDDDDDHSKEKQD